ncbi:MAG: hypothetical protein AAEJ53_01125 [Myxococcota bacterium]
MPRTVLFAEVAGFYAAVERAENPAVASRPIIVGGDPRKRGQVHAASSEARNQGVEPGMSMLEALQRCPSAKALRTDMRRYREASRRLHVALRSAYPDFEPFELGAVFAELGRSRPEALRVAEAMREVVRNELSMELRVGIASGKFLARLLAAEMQQGGVREIEPGDERGFLGALPASRIDGVGPKTEARLAEAGAHDIAGVAALGRERLEELFGSHGLRIHALATGSDDERVRARSYPKSLSRSTTLGRLDADVEQLSQSLGELTQRLAKDLGRQGLSATKLALRVRFGDQRVVTRSRRLAQPCAGASDLLESASLLLARIPAGSNRVHGLGVQLSGLVQDGAGDAQLDLFD